MHLHINVDFDSTTTLTGWILINNRCEESIEKLWPKFVPVKGAEVIGPGPDFRPGACPRSLDHIRPKCHVQDPAFDEYEYFDMVIAPSGPIIGAAYFFR